MANSRRKRRANTKRRSSGLNDHRRHKKTLTPPFLTIPRLRAISWQHGSLPDFLWLQAIREESGALPAANDALDILDEFVPEPSSPESKAEPPPEERLVDFLDGRLSSLNLIPEEQRADARAALRQHASWALPDGLGHGLALYPECPAGWLYEDWRREHHADPEVGIAYLKRLVTPLLDPRGRPSSQLRLIPLARQMKHGKMHLASGMEILDLLPRYPSDLGEEDQLHVEQWARATWGAFASMSDASESHIWSRYFWQQSWRVSTCDPESAVPRVAVEEDDEPVSDGSGPQPEEPSIFALRRGFVAAIDVLGAELRVAQHRANLDLYDPTADEVKLGLASRSFRLLRRLVADPEMWTNEMGPHLLRSLIDLRIIAAWLLMKDDPDLYKRFKDFGLGKRKLFKLQLEELMDNDELVDEDDEALHRRLEAEVNQDVLEEFVKIDLGGSFSGKTLREMAREAGLADLYSLQYQPLSTEAHGEWGSLIAFDLRHCGNPLHRYHRLAAFGTNPDIYVHLGWVRSAFQLADDTISAIFTSCGVDVAPLFGTCWTTLEHVRLGEQGKEAP